ncbi:TPA: DNA N-6-adenine-methyltransferase [Escherichia coli]|nr:hypothetical protein [Escherichia coli]HBC8456880.1 hypothetical protein [Escherichia coli]
MEEGKKKDKLAIHYTSGHDVWCTPKDFFKKLDDVWHFTLDSACVKETALCSKYYTPETNGLVQDWGNEIVWCNCPYSDIKSWLIKCTDAYNKGATVMILVPSRTETIAFQDYACPVSDAICFIKGRLKFVDPHNPHRKTTVAPFPSCLLVMDRNLTQAKINLLKSLGNTMVNI